jgi:hypothetical protein
VRAPVGDRIHEGGLVESFDGRAIVEDSDRNGPPSARDEIVVRSVVLVDVVGRERHVFA